MAEKLIKQKDPKDTYLKTNAGEIRKRGTFIHVSKQGVRDQKTHKTLWGPGKTRKTKDSLGKGIGKEVLVIIKNKKLSNGMFMVHAARKERKGLRDAGFGIKGTWEEACKAIRLKNKRAGWRAFDEKAILAGVVT